MYKNGDMYIGNFVNGNKNGVGKMIYAEGGQYEGEWIDDE